MHQFHEPFHCQSCETRWGNWDQKSDGCISKQPHVADTWRGGGDCCHRRPDKYDSCIGCLPAFNELSGKTITFNQDNILYFGTALLLLTIITGLIAGSYPAFYMSSFKPAEVLKGKFSLGSASGKLRQGLVVLQFVVAIVLVCGMLVISRQLSFMKEKDLGFDPAAKIIIPLRTAEAKGKYTSLRSEVEQMSSVKAVSAAAFPPGTQVFNDMAFYRDGGSMENAILNRRNSIDAGYMELLGIKLIAGRTFTDNRDAESKG